MYDQIMSYAWSHTKYFIKKIRGCLGMQCCCEHEIVVTTMKKIQIGSIVKACSSLIPCSSKKFQILGDSKEMMYEI